MTARVDPARSRYSAGAIALHWIIGLLIIANLAGGLSLDTLFGGEDAASKATKGLVIGLHKSFGLTVLVLSLVRLGWRLATPPPPLPTHMTPLEKGLARATHVGFYLLMLLLPLSGWAMASTGRTVVPIFWFGLFEVPALPLPKTLGGLFYEGHEVLGFVAIGLLVLHVGGALKHNILDRDDVLARMLPLMRRPG